MKSFGLLTAIIVGIISNVASVQANVPDSAPINTYAIHEDGGLIYNPIYMEAKRTGQLAKFADIPKQRKTIKMDGYTLTCDIPIQAVGYDVVPIPYTIAWQGTANFPLAVEATAFEDKSRKKGKDLFDLALPGKLDLKVDYLGSITAHMKPDARHNLKADFSDTPGEFPAFTRKPMVRSGIVESGDIIWFKFRVKNTGNTILDPEGFGGWGLFPELDKKDASGVYKFHSNHYNLYIRDRKYLYPGESRDFWINFMGAGSMESYRIEPGDYKIQFRSYYRYYKEWNDWLNMWDGAWMFIAEMPLTIKPKPESAPVAPLKVTLTDSGQSDKLTRYIHTLEEFMTSFDCWQNAPSSANSVSGTLYLQVAPWTDNIVVKLINVDPMRCKTVASDILVDNSTLTLKPNLNPGNCIVKDGKRVPVIYSQLMSDMRANIQVSPWPEKHIKDDIARMMECGINVCATTAMPWLYTDLWNPEVNHPGDAMKYSLDVARKLGMKLEAWGSYPYDRSTVASVYKELTGDTITMDVFSSDGGPVVSQSDPNIAKANAAIWLYQFKRWGDAYAQFESGKIPFGTEDTRGWMRQDVHSRFPIGDLSKKNFREWVKNKYSSIDKVNAAWNSRYASFDEIDPEANTTLNMFGHRWEYLDQNAVFHDWNKAIADFDEWRTWLRIKNYRDSLDIIHKEVPQAVMILRTEGANAIVDGLNPSDPNPHYRHAFYNQRRVAANGDMITESKAFNYHSDYTTIPYTPTELRKLTKLGVKDDIIPAWLAQFDNMRDIAVNEKYGTDYQINYNADKPVKGSMMHVLTPVYTWFQAVIEEGGIPGILWEDLQCDGFTTETQQREMLFFKQKMEEYLQTPEGIKASTSNVKTPDQSWLKEVKPKISYKVK